VRNVVQSETRKVQKSVPQVVGFNEIVGGNGSIQRVPVIKETVFVFGVCPNGHAYDLPE
jgi:hypothetical protein